MGLLCCKKAPGKGLRQLITDGLQNRWLAAADHAGRSRRLGGGPAWQTLQPGTGARLKAQAARRAGHCLGSAAQNAQALLVKVMQDCHRSLGSRLVAFSHGVRVQPHKLALLCCHAQIVRAGSDVSVSVQWQLRDTAGHRTQTLPARVTSRMVQPGWLVLLLNQEQLAPVLIGLKAFFIIEPAVCSRQTQSGSTPHCGFQGKRGKLMGV